MTCLRSLGQLVARPGSKPSSSDSGACLPTPELPSEPQPLRRHKEEKAKQKAHDQPSPSLLLSLQLGPCRPRRVAPGLQAGPGHPRLPGRAKSRRRLPGSGTEQLPAATDHPDDSSSNRKRIGRGPSSAYEKKDAARAPTATGRAPRRPGLRPKSWMPEQEKEPPTDCSIDRAPAPSPYQTGEGGRARQGFFELGA